MPVGIEIKNARKKANLTQAELAEKSGLSLMSVRRYESGEREPTLSQIQDIAAALRVPTAYFIEPNENDSVDSRLGEIFDILKDYAFIVEQDEDDNTCGVVRLNHEEKGIATVVNVHDLIAIVDGVIADEEEEKERQIKKRFFDIFGGKNK